MTGRSSVIRFPWGWRGYANMFPVDGRYVYTCPPRMRDRDAPL